MLLNSLPEWISTELDTVNFGDERLNTRAMTILSDQYSKPQETLYGSSSDEANAKGVYRFQSNEKVSEEELLKSHREASVARAQQYSVVLGVHDTTQLAFSNQSQKERTGPLQTKKQQGFLLHPITLFTPEKLPLGTVDVNLWSRDEETFGKSKDRARLPIEEKESYRWLLSYRQLVQIQAQLPTSELVSVSDAESDIYELFLEAHNTAQGPTLLVRAAHNRQLENEVKKLWPSMEACSTGFEIELEIPRKGKQPARSAQAKISYAPVTLPAPSNKKGVPVKLYAVYVREINPPPGIDGVSWMLLTTSKVTKERHALKVIRWYPARWQIEIFFKILKTCCKILADQTHKSGHFEINLAFKLIVAWRIFYTTMLCRESPDISCEIVFSEDEWKALWCHDYKTTQLPDSPPTLQEITLMLARLGGYKQYNKNMVPGPLVLAKGFAILPAITSMFSLMNTKEYHP